MRTGERKGLLTSQCPPTGAADERRLVFDPATLADGIALSADPILLVRSASCSLSYDHRSQGE
jgi:hypothetical protein